MSFLPTRTHRNISAKLQPLVLLGLGDDEHRLEQQHDPRLGVLAQQSLLSQLPEHGQIRPQPPVHDPGQLLDAALLLQLLLDLVDVVRHVLHELVGMRHLLVVAVLPEVLKWKKNETKLLKLAALPSLAM